MEANTDASDSSAYALNYAAVLRRAAALQREDAQRAENEAPAVIAEEEREEPGTSDDQMLNDTRAPAHTQLNSPQVVAAKPYIPSYVAAVKAQSATVTLDGVPVNVNKARPQPNSEWCSSANFSNSMMEQDTNSSWADDDDAFLQSIARTTQARMGGGYAAVIRPNHYSESHDQPVRPQQRQPVDRSAPSRRQKGWTQVQPARNSSNPNSSAQSSEHSEGRQQRHKAPRGGSGKRENPQKQLSPVVPSGGCFDSLATAQLPGSTDRCSPLSSPRLSSLSTSQLLSQL